MAFLFLENTFRLLASDDTFINRRWLLQKQSEEQRLVIIFVSPRAASAFTESLAVFFSSFKISGFGGVPVPDIRGP